MKFIRYRQNFSHGHGEWEYSEAPYDKEEFVESLAHEYCWSDKYRGCDIEDIDRPPKEWIEKQIAYAQNRITRATAELKDYMEYLKNYEPI